MLCQSTNWLKQQFNDREDSDNGKKHPTTFFRQSACYDFHSWDKQH